MAELHETIPELTGATINKAEVVDGGSWFSIVVETTEGSTLEVGGYKADASGSLRLPDGTLREWSW